MVFPDPKSESGFAVAWVVTILMVVGIIIAAMLQLAPISLRAAVREQQSVKALAHAESGIAYALTWLESDAFDPDYFVGSVPHTLSEERDLGDGGFRELTVASRPNFEYEITSTGFHTGSNGREIRRTVRTGVKLVGSWAGGMFPRHLVDMTKLGLEPGDPGYEEEYDGLDYEQIEIQVPDLDPFVMPELSSNTCSNYGEISRDVKDEGGCRWPGNYSVPESGSPAEIDTSNLRIAGEMAVGSSSRVHMKSTLLGVDGSVTFAGNSRTDFENTNMYVSDSVTFTASNKTTLDGNTTIHTGGNFTITGDGVTEFKENTTLRVGGNMTLGGSGDFHFRGPTTIHVGGDLNISGSGTMDFVDGVTFYVSGSVNLSGSGWVSTTGVGEDPPWVVFYVQEGVHMSGGAGAGYNPDGHQNIPDVVFLLSTDPEYDDRACVCSNEFIGGVYAPTREVYLDYGTYWGSLVGRPINMPDWQRDQNEDEFREQYEAREERMRSFQLGTAVAGPQQVERLLEWQEVRGL